MRALSCQILARLPLVLYGKTTSPPIMNRAPSPALEGTVDQDKTNQLAKLGRVLGFVEIEKRRKLAVIGVHDEDIRIGQPGRGDAP